MGFDQVEHRGGLGFGFASLPAPLVHPLPLLPLLQLSSALSPRETSLEHVQEMRVIAIEERQELVSPYCSVAVFVKRIENLPQLLHLRTDIIAPSSGLQPSRSSEGYLGHFDAGIVMEKQRDSGLQRVPSLPAPVARIDLKNAALLPSFRKFHALSMFVATSYLRLVTVENPSEPDLCRSGPDGHGGWRFGWTRGKTPVRVTALSESVEGSHSKAIARIGRETLHPELS